MKRLGSVRCLATLHTNFDAKHTISSSNSIQPRCCVGKGGKDQRTVDGDFVLLANGHASRAAAVVGHNPPNRWIVELDQPLNEVLPSGHNDTDASRFK